MNEIARDTFDAERFYVVTRLMWESMEGQRPSAWRIVFKSLTLLEYLVKNGAERCVDDARNHAHILRALGQFNYYEGTIDRGLGVREKSKQLLEILGDDERIREERQKARKLREKFGQSNATASGGGGGGAYGGYGNQDSWNTGASSGSGGGRGGGGYGDGGIYDNDRGYSGRYGGSSRSPRSTSPVGAAPTFAAMPGEKKKMKKKKKKPVEAAPAPVASPEPGKLVEERRVRISPFESLQCMLTETHSYILHTEPDLLGFDSAPAPAAPAEPASEEFGAFQATPSAPAPAAGGDDFADFGALRAAPAPAAANDPFATPSAAPQAAQPQQQSFDAFGTNNTMGGGMMQGGGMNNGMAAPMMNNNNNAGGMSNVANAFGNMNMAGGVQPQQQQPAMAGDEDFGAFSAAKPSMSTPAVTMNSSDPMSKLINLDGLSKNPSAMKPQQKPQNNMMGNPMMGNQMGQNGHHQPGKYFHAPLVAKLHPLLSLAKRHRCFYFFHISGVVSAGGSDAISSMMGPGAQAQQMQQQRNSGMSQGSGGNMPGGMNNMNQGMMNQGMMNQGGMGMQGGMNNMNQGMGGMQGGMMNQGGMQNGVMNQGMGMGNMQGGMGGQQQWR